MLEIIQTILLRQILGRLAATPVTLSAAAASTDLRDNYAPTARQIADRLALLEKSQAQIDVDATNLATLLADSVYYSNAVNAAIAGGADKTSAVDFVFNNDADAARKARWTLAGVRALFGA